MKVLFSGYHNPNFLTITEYMENAIKTLGHEVFIFDERKYIFPGRIRESLPWLDRWDQERINRNIISLASKNRPDLAIITGGHGITAKTVKKFALMGFPTALWTTDAPRWFGPILDVAPHYDYIFCQGTEGVELFERAGIKDAYWLPVGCDPQIHKPFMPTNEKGESYAKKTVFVGSYYLNRWEILKELTEFDIGIWGPHWDNIDTDFLGSCSVESANLKHSEWLKIFTLAKIVIIIHYQDGKTLCYQASPKVYEALACGSFVLVDRQRDVFSQFRDGQHLIGFDGVNDLKEKIRYYLAHSDERMRIAAQGQKEVLNNHTYVHRIKKLFGTIKKDREIEGGDKNR